MQKLIITQDEEFNVSTNVEGEWTFQDFMTVMLTVIDNQVQTLLKDAEADCGDNTEAYDYIKGNLYDELNYVFGQMLERIIPDGNENSDLKLTAEAILRAENQILEEYSEKVKKDAENEQTDSVS